MERSYVLYTSRRGKIYYIEIRHSTDAPWEGIAVEICS